MIPLNDIHIRNASMLPDAVAVMRVGLLISGQKVMTEQEAMLEKQIAKSPNIWGDGYSDEELVYDMYKCPNCEVSYEIDDTNDYCPNCGQMLDWSEANE